jgi:hypothetical protein
LVSSCTILSITVCADKILVEKIETRIKSFAMLPAQLKLGD